MTDNFSDKSESDNMASNRNTMHNVFDQKIFVNQDQDQD